MKIALRRGAVADPGAHDPPLAAIRKRHRGAHRLRQLCSDWAGNRNHIARPANCSGRASAGRCELSPTLPIDWQIIVSSGMPRTSSKPGWR